MGHPPLVDGIPATKVDTVWRSTYTAFDISQAWEAGKAVRIGHGPATVIGEMP